MKPMKNKAWSLRARMLIVGWGFGSGPRTELILGWISGQVGAGVVSFRVRGRGWSIENTEI